MTYQLQNKYLGRCVKEFKLQKKKAPGIGSPEIPGAKVRVSGLLYHNERGCQLKRKPHEKGCIVVTAANLRGARRNKKNKDINIIIHRIVKV